MSLKNNCYITIINLNIINKGPMKVGNGDESILIDRTTNNPYLPGTSFAGALRAYLTKVTDEENVKEIFGHGDKESKINVCDSYAENKKEIEYRPGIRMNNVLGVNDKKGYFERELLGSGHKFNIQLKIYSKTLEEREEQLSLMKIAFSGINSGELRFGAYKTNGSGIFNIDNIKISTLDLENGTDLLAYLSNELNFIDATEEFVSKIDNKSIVKFIIKGETSTPILIKGLDTLNHELPDGSNIVNSNGEYILPGSSIKGAIRNAFGKVAKFKGIEDLIVETFGDEAGSVTISNDEKVSGRMYFEDIKIENHMDKSIYNRIKIDKFTGGVRTGAILKDNPIKGKFNSNILFRTTGNKEKDNKIVALMLFTLRDALKGEISFGSGNSVGRGKLKGDYIKVEIGEERLKLDLIGKNHENVEKIKELASSIN